MKKLAFFALLAAGSLTFQSCSSDDDNGGGNTPEQSLLPTTIDYGTEGKDYFVYNNKQLVKYTHTFGEEIYTFDFTYSGGKVSKIMETSLTNINHKYEFTVTYEANNNIKIVEKDLNGNHSATSTYQIDANGNLVSGSGSFYTYENGNLTKMSEYGDVTTLTYNSNLAINKNVNTPGWVYTMFEIFPLAKSKNLINTINVDNVTTTLNYSDYSTGNLFPKTINYTSTDGDSGKITITYQ